MLQNSKVETEKTPKALGPYSQAIIAGNFIFCSGQIAINPLDGKMIGGGIMEQTRRVIENLKAILIMSGSNLGQVVRTEIYLKNMNDFEIMNEIYSKYFDFHPLPTRVTVEISRLPKDALIEIGCVAYKK